MIFHRSSARRLYWTAFHCLLSLVLNCRLPPAFVVFETTSHGRRSHRASQSHVACTRRRIRRQFGGIDSHRCTFVLALSPTMVYLSLVYRRSFSISRRPVIPPPKRRTIVRNPPRAAASTSTMVPERRHNQVHRSPLLG